MSSDKIERAIRLVKAIEDEERTLLITLKKESMKQVFQDLNKLQDAGAPFNKVIIIYDLK